MSWADRELRVIGRRIESTPDCALQFGKSPHGWWRLGDSDRGGQVKKGISGIAGMRVLSCCLSQDSDRSASCAVVEVVTREHVSSVASGGKICESGEYAIVETEHVRLAFDAISEARGDVIVFWAIRDVEEAREARRIGLIDCDYGEYISRIDSLPPSSVKAAICVTPKKLHADMQHGNRRLDSVIIEYFTEILSDLDR